MTRRLAAALVLLCLLAAGAVALAPRVSAAGPQIWRIEGARAFLEGELTALSVDALGRLRLGPMPRLVSDLAAPNAWAVARDAKGALYIGTGNDGRVVRVEGKAGSAVFDSDELEVHAVAVGPDGRVYAGTSPDGAVYAIDATGRVTRFFDPEEKYIWAVAFDKSGNLYVATGGEGKVYRVDRSGRASVYLATSEAHVLSLAIDARGRLFAGTSPDGRVYRVDEQGRAFVIYDSPFHEIRALDVAADGALYVAAVDGSGTETRRSAPPASAGPAASPGPVAEVTVSESFSIVAPGASAPVPVGAAAAETAAAAKAPRGAVLRLTPDGEADTLWSSSEDAPHAIAALESGGVLVGTGDKGSVYRVRGAGDWSLVATLPAEHVTAISRAGGDDAVVVTSNPARVYAIDATPAAQGTFVSTVKDAEAAARWGRVFWEGAAPPGTSVRLETRVGNTDRPDATWSDWTAGGDAAGADPGRGDRARFCQLRVTLQGRGGSTPAVETVAAAYLQRNLPPQVKSITVHGPGEVFQKPISVSGDPEILGLATESAGDRSAAARGGAVSPPAIAFSRKLYQRGLRTFSWQADDPNDDALSYDVLYRAVGEERWRPLRQGLDEPVIAWDTTAVPNGRYVVRVVASDAPANPPALATTASRDSVSFEIDNSPPAIEAAYDAGRRLVRVEVKDESAVRRLDFSIDGSRWEEIHPVDGIADSPRERYEVPLPGAAGTPRLMVLRASDLLGNVSTLRVDLP
jgi:ligand-binding sensor domain-containing protein